MWEEEPESAPHDIFGDRNLADAFVYGMEVLHIRSEAFARAYQSHPTWHLQHAELSKGWEYMLQGVLARAEVKRQERLAADVALILKCLKEMIELAEQEREKSAEVPMGNKVVELPPIRAWVTEMLQGAEPGPIGTALISVFESLGGEESKV